MPKVIYTLGLGPDNTLDNLIWERLDNGHYLSPDITEEQLKRYLDIPGFREIKVPAPAPAPAAKKAPAKKTTAKPKGD